MPDRRPPADWMWSQQLLVGETIDNGGKCCARRTNARE
jgi:hypothetical protein